MRLSGATIGTYCSQYRPLSAIRYIDANPLPTRYTLFITSAPNLQHITFQLREEASNDASPSFQQQPPDQHLE
jgi:hypothetical protein